MSFKVNSIGFWVKLTKRLGELKTTLVLLQLKHQWLAFDVWTLESKVNLRGNPSPLINIYIQTRAHQLIKQWKRNDEDTGFIVSTGDDEDGEVRFLVEDVRSEDGVVGNFYF